jgi:hypothetical protein
MGPAAAGGGIKSERRTDMTQKHTTVRLYVNDFSIKKWLFTIVIQLLSEKIYYICVRELLRIQVILGQGGDGEIFWIGDQR